ncbi:unnamed protein product [Taenia asiatica]|uniref:Uncharacterized protein n=1 Tax=Taenia asiatica TaxID=60517 RepID=A0A3P6NJL7_TAEAS|nr:unnamed protein product [Taenia asiatica]
MECLDMIHDDVTSGARRGQRRLQGQLECLDIDPRRVECQMTSPVAPGPGYRSVASKGQMTRVEADDVTSGARLGQRRLQGQLECLGSTAS